jgi:homoserine O-acetyltransferase/O-succinyltransferase
MLYQGQKFVKRFDANSYLRIIDAWQQFDLARGRQGPRPRTCASLPRCQPPEATSSSASTATSASIPTNSARSVAEFKRANIPRMRLIVHSDKGHDSFLLEPKLYAPHFIYSLEHPWAEHR